MAYFGKVILKVTSNNTHTHTKTVCDLKDILLGNDMLNFQSNLAATDAGV